MIVKFDGPFNIITHPKKYFQTLVETPKRLFNSSFFYSTHIRLNHHGVNFYTLHLNFKVARIFYNVECQLKSENHLIAEVE